MSEDEAAESLRITGLERMRALHKASPLRQSITVEVLSHQPCKYAPDKCSIVSLCAPCESLIDTMTAIAERALPWTKTPPMAPGYYWARQHGQEPETVQVTDWIPNQPLVAWPNGSDVQSDLDAFDLWAGPITPPPLPKEGE